MKYLAAVSTLFLSLFVYTSNVLAADVGTINLQPPNKTGINPETPLQTILSNIITIVFIVAALMVLFMLIWGAFQWITSAGDKEKVGAARNRIINALIGLAILALAFLILKTIGSFLNINVLDLVIPKLGPAPGESIK